MATSKQIDCKRCKKKAWVTCGIHSHPDYCNPCNTIVREEKNKAYYKDKAYYAELDKLTVEERLRQVEKAIYEFRPYNGPIKY